MQMKYIPRDAESYLKNASQSFPVLAVSGPRQSGKTSLVRHAFSDKPYVNLESPEERDLYEQDTKRFLARFPHGAVIDEIQHAPDLLSWIQVQTDEARTMGRYILTSSQNLLMVEEISQSLAGRCATLTLLPFSKSEQTHLNKTFSLEQSLFQGGYPPVFQANGNPTLWLDSYIQTYLERDVRQGTNVRDVRQGTNVQDLNLFRRFLALCAGRNGQILNITSLAADAGITANTAKSWLSVLEASFLVFQLQPWYENFRKRIVKSPKLYFYDTGLVCRLLGIQTAEQLLTHPLRGAIFESWVVSEVAKMFLNKMQRPSLYYWRESNGLEVDLLIETGGSILPVEIKSGMTFASDFTRNLEKWMALSKTPNGAVIYGGDKSLEIKNFYLISWENISSLSALF